MSGPETVARPARARRADASPSEGVPLYGLVLAGGKSRRMGRPKWALEYHGEPHALHLREMLTEHCEMAFLSLRPDQAAEPGVAGVPLVVDAFEDLGPLGGILSAMRLHPGAAWLVLACDLPFVSHATLEHLLAQRHRVNLATAYRSPQDGLPEPLCAVYEPSALQRLEEAAADGRRCPRKVLIDAGATLIDSLDARELTNANLPTEYERALASLERGDRMTQAKSVTIDYFAVLREARGEARETLETTAATAAELYEELRVRHGFSLPRSALRVAVNDDFVPWEHELRGGDRVSFIPPVAGG